jgi:hypothetical protein
VGGWAEGKGKLVDKINRGEQFPSHSREISSETLSMEPQRFHSRGNGAEENVLKLAVTDC